MEQLLTFTINHWYLVLLLVIILSLLAYSEFSGQVHGVARISPQQVVQLMNHEKAAVIDTRDGAAYNNGHILGAIHSVPADIKTRLEKFKKNKSRPIIIVCASGQSAPKTGALFIKEGFQKVMFLQGGMAAWQSASLPVTKE